MTATAPRATTRTGITATARKLRFHSIAQFGDYDYVITHITPGSGSNLHVTAQRCGAGPEHRQTFTLHACQTVDVIRF